MKIGVKPILACVAMLAAATLCGCGEREQVVVYKQGKYQGKPDTKPWENDPGAALYTTSKWTRGDKTSWETAVKARSLTQNEYARTE